jgi:hypothetical protein
MSECKTEYVDKVLGPDLSAANCPTNDFLLADVCGRFMNEIARLVALLIEHRSNCGLLDVRHPLPSKTTAYQEYHKVFTIKNGYILICTALPRKDDHYHVATSTSRLCGPILWWCSYE